MTLQTIDLLYLTLAVGFAIIVYAIFTLVKRVQKTLDNVDYILTNVRHTTDDITNIKNKATGTFYSAASMLLGMLFRKKR
jgi:uncharacterized protein YoxC